LHKQAAQLAIIALFAIVFANLCVASPLAKLTITLRISVDGALLVTETINLRTHKTIRSPVRSIYAHSGIQGRHEVLSLAHNDHPLRATVTKSGFVLGKKNSTLIPGDHEFRIRYVVYDAIESGLLTAVLPWVIGDIGHHITFTNVSMLITFPKRISSSNLVIKSIGLEGPPDTMKLASTVDKTGNINLTWSSVDSGLTTGFTLNWPSNVMLAANTAATQSWFFTLGKYIYWGWLGLFISAASCWFVRYYERNLGNNVIFPAATALSFAIIYGVGVFSTRDPYAFSITFIATLLVFFLLRSNHNVINIKPGRRWRIGFLIAFIFALCWDITVRVTFGYFLLVLGNCLVLFRPILRNFPNEQPNNRQLGEKVK
jgi:hypothetical protein